MFKIILLLLCMTFGTSQAVSFDCQYISGSWSGLGTVYYCSVQNSVTITSPDAAQVDSVTGSHLAGYTNDNVEAFSFQAKRQVHYFPRGLDKIFKNLIGIYIGSTGLKEIHQSDLKDLPKLRNLYLQGNNLEILEANLFKFNPNLDWIYLHSNKISHIDPNVFDKLTRLKDMNLNSSTCISMSASDNRTAVQNIIKTASTRCINSDYSNLEHKVKDLEAASSTLNSEQLKENLEKLENDVKNSNFPNFFQNELQNLKASQVKKAQEEHFSALVSKACRLSITDNLTNLMTLATNGTDSQQDMINEKFTKMSQNIAKIDEKLTGTAAKMDENIANLKEVALKFQMSMPTNMKDEVAARCEDETKMLKNSKKIEKIDIKLDILEEILSNFQTFSYKKFNKMEIEEKVFHVSMKKSIESSNEEIDRKIGEIQAKMDAKFDEIDGKLVEMERKFGEKIEEILKIVK